METLKKILLKSSVDAFNAGYGKKIQRLHYCKKAKELVVQQKQGEEWLCLHD